MHDRLRHQVLSGWCRFVCRWPWWVLGVALTVAAGSVGITLTGLEFQSDRNALLSMELDWNRNFEQWRTRFPGNEDLYVVVDAGDVASNQGADRLARAQAVVDELGPALQADPNVELAVWGFGHDQFSPRTIRLLPMPEFETRLAEMAQSGLVLASPSPQRMLAAVMRQMQQTSEHTDEAQIADAMGGLTRVVTGIGRVLASPPGERPGFARLVEQEEPATPRWQYLVSDSGRLFFIRVTPRKEVGALNALSAAITAIRSHIDRVLARHAGIEAGLTGIDVVEADETDAATRDSMIASIIASVLITVMLIVAFHSWRIPLLAMVALLMGIAWSFGFLTLAVGHLQVLSVVFVVILLGLGIAFGVHLAARVELVRHGYDDGRHGLAMAMHDSFQTVGPGVITGAVTTAAAFCMTMLTDFRGGAEMGRTADSGIVLCLFAMFSVFPAMLCLFAPDRRHHVPFDTRRFHLFDPTWVMPFVRWPRATLGVAILLTTASLLAVTQMTFDYDLLKLQPRGVDSVQWQDRITRDGGQSIWSAVSVVNSLEAARQRKSQLRQLDTVGQVNGIGLLFPDDEDQKLARIDDVWRELEPLVAALTAEPGKPDRDAVEPELMVVLSTMRLAIQAATGRDMPAGVRVGLNDLTRELNRTLDVYAGLDGDQRQAREAQLRSEYTQWRQAVSRRVVEALDRSPLTPGDMPAELLRPYTASGGDGYALEIHPKLPQQGNIDGPLDPRFLPVFVRQLETIDPEITGVVAQIYRSGDLILHSYQMAGLYALAVVLGLVWFDFRSLRAAVLSLVPVAAGFAVTFGVMWLSSVSVNPANIIVLPLMFGIGVDSGVHLIHRYRQDPKTRPLGLTGGTGKGITVTSVTTMIGFGSMMFARHRGIASLGFVMTTGIGMTLLACWTVVPAWLELRSHGRSPRID